MDADGIRRDIERIAREALIDEVRFVDANDIDEVFFGGREALPAFSARQPRSIMPDARTVIVFATYIGAFYMPREQGAARTTRLTLSGFYSNIVKPLAPVAEYLAGMGCKTAVCDTETDEAFVPLKPLAVKAGLGWTGKNSLVVSHRYGSFLALGAIVTNADVALEYAVQQDGCGECTRCMQACPSGALDTPRRLTRPLCVSNLLENETPSDAELANTLENAGLDGFFFECDVCQNACPHNQKHIRQPLDTPYGRAASAVVERARSVMGMERLLNMTRGEYEREIAPLIAGFELPYALFYRNVRLVAANGDK